MNKKYKNTFIFIVTALTLLSPLSPSVVKDAHAAPPIGISPSNEFTTPTPSSLPMEIIQGSDGNMWFAEYVGKISKITPAGVITEYDAGVESPVNLTLGSDGAIWFTSPSYAEVRKITIAGDVESYPLNYAPQKLAAGPDGNMWTVGTQFIFGTGNVGTISKVTSSGLVTDYTSPTPESQLSSITSGPDGNMWFTLAQYSPSAVGKIGKITPAGVITEYGGLTSDFIPLSIAAGPDSNVWFTEQDSQFSSKIGKITPSGTVTEYDVADNIVNFLVQGPDSNMWFVKQDDSSNKSIGKITPAGVITEFSVPDVSFNKGGLVAGPDGNMWFTAPNTNKLSQITPSGTITEFSVPTANSRPDYLAFDPDGKPWITETNGNKVAYLAEVRPYIISANPTFSPPAGGGTITINGSFFQPGNTVSLYNGANNITLPLNNVVVVDGQTITATIPASSINGVYSLTVTNELGASNSLPFTYGTSPITSVDFVRNGSNQLTMLINGTGLLSSGQLITQAVYAQPVITLNGVAIGFCTTPTYTATLLAGAGVPAGNYSDDPPCLELFDPAGGFNNASSLTDQQIAVVLPDDFDTSAPFEVSVWNVGSFSGNQSGGGTDPGGGTNPGGSSSGGSSSASQSGSGLSIPGVPNTGVALMVTEKMSNVSSSAWAAILTMSTLTLCALGVRRRFIHAKINVA